MNLEDVGFDDWFRGRLTDPKAESKAARVVAVDRDRYLIAGAPGSLPAELTGKLTYGADTTEDLPCVGDWVIAEYYDSNAHAIIHEVLPRRTILRRRSPGQRVDYQPIAANVDVAFIVQSCDVDYNLNRLDRYLAVANDGGIHAVLLLTKCDLVSASRLDAMIAEVRREHRVDVIPLSSTTGAGYPRFREALQQRRTYCLIGSSGVGKSTILNTLAGTEELATRPVRDGGGRGRHTTTRRQLVVLDNGSLFVDTPGMRELGMLGFGVGIEASFDDIAAISPRCSFADCTHTTEKGCAVLSSIARGELSEERYQSYLKLRKESTYYEMTLLEKRKKDRAFGKMRKNYKKNA